MLTYSVLHFSVMVFIKPSTLSSMRFKLSSTVSNLSSRSSKLHSIGDNFVSISSNKVVSTVSSAINKPTIPHL